MTPEYFSTASENFPLQYDFCSKEQTNSICSPLFLYVSPSGKKPQKPHKTKQAYQTNKLKKQPPSLPPYVSVFMDTED